MKVFFEDLRLSTRSRTELVDITRNVEDIIRKGVIKNGLCIIHTVHSTTAIIVNEHQAGLTEDILRKVRQEFPKGARMATR